MQKKKEDAASSRQLLHRGSQMEAAVNTKLKKLTEGIEKSRPPELRGGKEKVCQRHAKS